MEVPVIARAAEIAAKVHAACGAVQFVDHGVIPPEIDVPEPIWYHKFTWRSGDAWCSFLLAEGVWRTLWGRGLDVGLYAYFYPGSNEDAMVEEVVNWFTKTLAGEEW